MLAARASTLQERFLPHGPLDLVRQVLLFVASFQLYRLTRGIVNDPSDAVGAFNNARDLIGIEQTLNIFIEPSIQAFASGQQWLLDGASWMYINAQTTVTLGALLWIYLFRNSSFYFVRNMSCSRSASRSWVTRCTPLRRRASCRSGASLTPLRTSPASRRTTSRSTRSPTSTRPCHRCTSRSRS